MSNDDDMSPTRFWVVIALIISSEQLINFLLM